MKSLTILNYQWKDLVRGKWIFGYALIYLLISDALIRFGGSGPKALLSISNVMLLLVPLVSMIYGALYLYQSKEFTELLLAQPLNRKTLFWGLYGGLAIPLSSAYTLGVLIPMLYSGMLNGEQIVSILMLLALGIILTLLFTGIGFWLGLSYFEDRIKGLGFALVGWLFLAVLYDGLVLLIIFMLGDYPIEKPMLALTMLNPIDLARIIVLLEFDISALMGYTGAIFNRFFGSFWGIITAGLSLMLWLVIPLWGSTRKFREMDF
ncbi:ABC transporter permease [Gracilimonas mengyeensis]|uniref:Cu-processing system permease protein n=1 Tax=Gracilimonas mengyeensis TaxID=1302730 RepID=A0A521F1J1_9BACT|nr:ABC transporter permease [Gracilimonas mengyeensis]SMO89936.1 Cu-processing system permease protein [Gracilimonas mengyeensis]